MSEEVLVRHCSPTLAGLKTGSIFTYVFEDAENLKESMRKLNRLFARKGLRVLPLRCRKNRALVYVFRPARLMQDLRHGVAEALLRERGYDNTLPERCVVQLIRRLQESEDFPHEIGLFLGYPPEDVHGFIENKPNSCKLVGCWKVYGNETEARKRFSQYKKCTEVYAKQLAKGNSIERLAVAG